MKKADVLKKAKEYFENTIASFDKSIEQEKQQYDLDETETKDPEDMSNQNVSRDIAMRLELQRDQAKNNLSRVDELAATNVDNITNGALVETDKKYFLFGISAPEIELDDDKPLLCISTEAPVYAELAGKKKGDSFQLGKESFKILNIV